MRARARRLPDMMGRPLTGFDTHTQRTPRFQPTFLDSQGQSSGTTTLRLNAWTRTVFTASLDPSRPTREGTPPTIVVPNRRRLADGLSASAARCTSYEREHSTTTAHAVQLMLIHAHVSPSLKHMLIDGAPAFLRGLRSLRANRERLASRHACIIRHATARCDARSFVHLVRITPSPTRVHPSQPRTLPRSP